MTQKEELMKIVGMKNVFDDSETLAKYSTDESFAAAGMPSLVVKPNNTEAVQGVVKWANESNAPLIPVSSPDGPRFRGDTIPSQGGVMVDLSGMHKILNIHRRDKVAMIEPGVTFDQLESELREQGLRALKPLLPRRTKSVLASCLEREPIVVPREHWDAIDPLCCIEVVFGTGDVFRTGSAAGPGTVAEQLAAGATQTRAPGPSQTDFARVIQGAQGTLGIVSWATVLCGIVPEMQKAFFVGSDNLDALIKLTYQLTRDRIGEELFLLNGFTLATIMGPGSDEIRKLSAKLPSWVLFFNLTGYEYFPDEQIGYQEEQVGELAQGLGLSVDTSVDGFSGEAMMKLLDNPPEQYYKLGYKGACQEIFFTTQLDKTPGFIDKIYKELDACGYSANEVGIYIQPMTQGCSCHCEFTFSYDPGDAKEKERLKGFLDKASVSLADSGAFFSRPYGPWADFAYRKDPKTTAALRKVKEIFDPKKILNPGKIYMKEN